MMRRAETRREVEVADEEEEEEERKDSMEGGRCELSCWRQRRENFRFHLRFFFTRGRGAAEVGFMARIRLVGCHTAAYRDK